MVFNKVGDMHFIFPMALVSAQKEAYSPRYSPIYAHCLESSDSKPTLHCRAILDPLKSDPALEFFMKLVEHCLRFPKTPRSPQLDHRVPSYGLTKEERSKYIKIQELFTIFIKAQ